MNAATLPEALSRPSFAVHVDCDNLWVYEREFGLDAGRDYDAIYEKGLPNLFDLLKEYGVRATFFIIGSETERASCRAFCARALREGHQLGNHSYSHSSAFGSSGRDGIAREIGAADEALRKYFGYRAKGFRAPGYQVSMDAASVLVERGYAYDSSILPGPAGLMMRLYMLLKGEGQGKEKSFNEWAALASPRSAYRLNAGPGEIFEVPLAVSPWLRLPVHSTFAYKFGDAYLRHALKGLKRQRGHHIYLLHAIDLLDHSNPACFQGRVVPFNYSFASRRATIESALREMAGHTAVTEEIFAAAESHRALA